MTGRLLSRSGSNESKTYTLSKMKKKITLFAVVFYVVFVLFIWRFPWAAMEDGGRRRFPEDANGRSHLVWFLERYGHTTFVLNNFKQGKRRFHRICFKETEVNRDEIQNSLVNLEFSELVLEDVKISADDLLFLLEENEAIRFLLIIENGETKLETDFERSDLNDWLGAAIRRILAKDEARE